MKGNLEEFRARLVTQVMKFGGIKQGDKDDISRYPHVQFSFEHGELLSMLEDRAYYLKRGNYKKAVKV